MNNKKTVYIAIAVIVIAAIGFGIYEYTKNNSTQEEMQQNPNNTPTPTPTTTPTPTPTSSTGGKLNYGDAIKAYRFRYQFVNCSANPGQMTVKKGTAVMLDNRDKVAHTIKANGQTVRIPALDYAVIYPKQVTVGEPTTATPNMTCDGGGSALLNVEK